MYALRLPRRKAVRFSGIPGRPGLVFMVSRQKQVETWSGGPLGDGMATALGDLFSGAKNGFLAPPREPR